MTIEEAIEHCEAVADGKTEQGKCPECAAEHKQLAEWLRELSALRTQKALFQGYRNDQLLLPEEARK